MSMGGVDIGAHDAGSMARGQSGSRHWEIDRKT
jgi:hypothetical protein